MSLKATYAVCSLKNGEGDKGIKKKGIKGIKKIQEVNKNGRDHLKMTIQKWMTGPTLTLSPLSSSQLMPKQNLWHRTYLRCDQSFFKKLWQLIRQVQTHSRIVIQKETFVLSPKFYVAPGPSETETINISNKIVLPYFFF